MNTIFLFEARRISKHWPSYLIALILVFIGIFCGNRFNLSVGEGIYLNSPYTTGYMMGMLSLAVIFLLPSMPYSCFLKIRTQNLI